MAKNIKRVFFDILEGRSLKWVFWAKIRILAELCSFLEALRESLFPGFLSL